MSGNSVLEEISRKLDAILNKLSLLEQLALEDPKYVGSAETLKLTRIFLSLYGEPLKILARLRAAESYIHHESIRRDEIARYIIQALAIRGPMNISSVTREVKLMRGKASRRIIRERLKKLEKAKIIRQIEGAGRTYSLAETPETVSSP
ncbi:MAG: hypothetical protein QXJ19_07235 [Candidatus Bathyarchaeia archaeon]|nr:hypothetical protein [Candidatus Bathyarchaeota archaeon]